MSNVFGRIYVPTSLTTSVTTTLQKWFPTFLKEVESQLGLPVGQLVPPRNYTSRNKYDALPGEELPKVVVICPGLIGQPLKSGRVYRAIWRLGVGVAIAADSEEDADLFSKIYGAAARDIILKKQGEYGANNVEWIDEAYDDLPLRDQIHQYRAAALWFAVDVENVATQKPGPDTPDSEPYTYHTADQVIIDKEKL